MKKLSVILALILVAWSCKKPFSLPANISADGRFLVIEGVISMNDSTFIRLSRTKKVDTFKTIIPERGAQVYIESNANAIYPLTETGPGAYAALPLNLDASRQYRLRVKTTDGKVYLSDYVPVKNSPAIDSIGFNAQSQGVQIYANTHDDANATKYYRWEYQETWQFHSWYASGYRNDWHARAASDQKHSCFGNDTSTNIILANTTKLTTDLIYQLPLAVIPANSEKIETKYSILVKQYALTSDAYSFWQNLQTNTEKIGGIFDVLPSQLQSNFHCVTNPGEPVVGYLSAGNVASKRIFITVDQLPSSYSPQYPGGACKIDTLFYVPANQQQVNDNALYRITMKNDSLIDGLFANPDVLGFPYAYTYSTGLCVDCTIRGTRVTPSFWK
ncbi:MAG TPA: DUF4249 domain-containing protein [Mucilaginibacter sp.]|nr:DUF4249 domain-containing protein [Mucilaginibacter sp.]